MLSDNIYLMYEIMFYIRGLLEFWRLILLGEEPLNIIILCTVYYYLKMEKRGFRLQLLLKS